MAVSLHVVHPVLGFGLLYIFFQLFSLYLSLQIIVHFNLNFLGVGLLLLVFVVVVVDPAIKLLNVF